MCNFVENKAECLYFTLLSPGSDYRAAVAVMNVLNLAVSGIQGPAGCMDVHARATCTVHGVQPALCTCSIRVRACTHSCTSSPTTIVDKHQTQLVKKHTPCDSVVRVDAATECWPQRRG